MTPWHRLRERALALIAWSSRQNLWMLLGLVLLGALGWLFVEAADEVIEPGTPVVDEILLKALRANADGTDPIGPPWVETAVVNISALGSGPVVLVIVLISVGWSSVAGGGWPSWSRSVPGASSCSP